MLETAAAVALAALGLPWLASSGFGGDLGQALQGWGSSWLGELNQLNDTLAAGLREELHLDGEAWEDLVRWGEEWAISLSRTEKE